MKQPVYPSTLATEPKVWMNLSQEQLDWAYDQAHHAPNRVDVLAKIASNSAVSRSKAPSPLRLAYGSQEIEHLDWYVSERQNAPLVFFVHGGAWKSGSAKDNALQVHWLIKKGFSVVIPDFDAVTSVQGNLAHLAQQVQNALLFTHREARVHHADPQKIVVVGHSSGAHLSACMVTRNWEALGLKEHPVRALLCCSGMYELEPVSLSARSQYVDFNPAVIEDLSPLRRIEAFQMPVALLCGEHESPEFIRQFRDFEDRLKLSNAKLQSQWIEGVNHFEILETLFDEHSAHARALSDLMDSIDV